MYKNVVTSFYSLPKDSLWEEEKPYTLKFQPVGDFPGTNRERVEKKGILVEDIRGRESLFSIDRNGFAIMRLKDPTMTYQDFHDDEKVKSLYLKTVAEELKNFLGARRVQIFDFVIRKSHPQFPVATGERYPYKQPANILHLDSMPDETRTQVQILNPQDAEQLLERRYQYVNVWKPLVGPVRNWPLAVCDKSSINFSEDIASHDSVFPESLVETGELHVSDKHKFYYLSDQEVDEAMILLQTDSVSGSGVPHASFENPLAVEAGIRESIEIRSIVFY